MKKLIYALILLLVVVSGLVFANRGFRNGASKQAVPQPLTAAERNAELKKWEATPEGIQFKTWKASPKGKKVLAGAAKLNSQVKTSASMEAVVTSLSLPPGSRLGFGLMVRINDEDYMLSFGPLKSNEFQQLRSLNLNDKIVIKSHAVMYAPKYAYPIVSGDYVERDRILLYKRPPHKGGC